MPIASTTVLNLVDVMASMLGQAMQMARTRLASTASPILRLMIQRDHEVTESESLRRELDILHTSRKHLSPKKRPDYQPARRLAILQLMRLRGWNMKTTAKRFVSHENTLRVWIKAAEGNGKDLQCEVAIGVNGHRLIFTAGIGAYVRSGRRCRQQIRSKI